MSVLKKIFRFKNDIFRKIKLFSLNSFINITSRPKQWNPDKIKKVLLLRLDDKIGDMVITTGTAKQLFDNGYEVSLLTGQACKSMLDNYDIFSKIYLYKKRLSFNILRSENFDVVIDFDDVFNYERLRLLFKVKPTHTIGFNKPNAKAYSINLNFLDSNLHISDRHKKVLSLFKIPEKPFKYYLTDDLNSSELIPQSTSLLSGKIIAVNPFTGSEDKDFSREQVQCIIDTIYEHNKDHFIIFIGLSEKLESLKINNIQFLTNSTIKTAISLVRKSHLVISPDTSIVHISCAFDIPLLAIYNSRRLKDTGLLGYKIWAPNYSNASQFISESLFTRDIPLNTIKILLKKKLLETF